MKSIGILGGGQLALFLSQSSKKAKVETWILSPSNTNPASQNNPFWIKGKPNHLADLKSFLKKRDILSFESEFFPADKIKQALKNKKLPLIAPSLTNLKNIQDRLYQKKLLKKHQLETADFISIDFKNKCDFHKSLLKIWNKWGPFILKSRMGGYDGRGTYPVQKKSQIKQIFPKTSFIAEKWIPFKRELAILAGRNKKEQIIFFPLVESFQKNSTCLWVKGPIQHKKLKNLKIKIKKFLNSIDYQGVIAFELFDTPTGLIINELAPRVHNTGHYSLDALTEDQFTIHLKAISNQNLKNPKLKSKAFAMLNLLGTGSKTSSFKQKSLFDKDFQNQLKKQNIQLYWYGKKASHRGRNMGHLNSLGSSRKSALDKLLKLKPFFKV